MLNQYERDGKVSDSMAVSTILMLVYITKFFWWEAGYWNTMDIAHDRGKYIYCYYFVVRYLYVLNVIIWFDFCSWILYLLGMFGLGSIYIYFTWHVPCQPSCESWCSGYFFSLSNINKYFQQFLFVYIIYITLSVLLQTAGDFYSDSRNFVHIH